MFLFPFLFSSVACFQQSDIQRPSRGHGLKDRLGLRLSSKRPLSARASNKKRCGPCVEEPSDDVLLDRREAAFAMLGTVWAAGALPTALLFPEAADAAYGTDARISLPNPIEAMNDRATKQCLVESLGNRECLVYADDSNKLYEGADTRLLLERIDKASVALASIPELAQQKKWSQVLGVLTGPMGELMCNMGLLADLSENPAASKEKVKKVKTDLYAISAAVERKDAGVIIKNHEAATKDLVLFVKSL